MSEDTIRVVSELHRDMDLNTALAWFNGIFSGGAWSIEDRLEVIADDGHRTVSLTAIGRSWSVVLRIEESVVLGGVLVSAQVRGAEDPSLLPQLSDFAKVLVP